MLERDSDFANWSTGITLWVTKYRSEDTWNIWSGLASRCRRWLAVCSFPVRRGGSRCAING